MDNIHSDANICMTEGGFEVKDHPLQADVGRRAVFIEPRCKAEEDEFEVVGVQKMWGRRDGRYAPDVIGHRVVGDEDMHRFGRCASPGRLKFLT